MTKYLLKGFFLQYFQFGRFLDGMVSCPPTIHKPWYPGTKYPWLFCYYQTGFRDIHMNYKACLWTFMCIERFQSLKSCSCHIWSECYLVGGFYERHYWDEFPLIHLWFPSTSRLFIFLWWEYWDIYFAMKNLTNFDDLFGIGFLKV